MKFALIFGAVFIIALGGSKLSLEIVIAATMIYIATRIK